MTGQFTVELSDSQAAMLKESADMTDASAEEFARVAVLNRVQGVDNVLQRQADRQRGRN